MKKHKSTYEEALSILHNLKEEYPGTLLSQHLSIALSDYGNFWGISDKELLFALTKYQSEMEINMVPEREVEKIVEEGKNLEKLFQEDEEDEDVGELRGNWE